MKLNNKGVTVKFVRVLKGQRHWGEHHKDIFDTEFPLIEGKLQFDNKGHGPYIMVGPVDWVGYPRKPFKLYVESTSDYVILGSEHQLETPALVRAPSVVTNENSSEAAPAPVLHGEDDDEIKARIAKRFRILDQLIWAAGDGHVTGLVISGPPGVGKSYGVASAMTRQTDMTDVMNKLVGSTEDDDGIPMVVEKKQPINHSVVSGHVTPRGLYETLYQFSKKGDVVVFDDCDGLLFQEITLNYLKKVMQTGTEERVVSWIKSADRPEGNTPERFTFHGSVVFITNINFDRPQARSSNIAEHLSAIMDRVYYLDLTINTLRDKFLRIDQVCRDFGVLQTIGLDFEQRNQVMAFFEANINNFIKVSVRTAQKIGTLCLFDSMGWQDVAAATMFKAGAQVVMVE